MSLFEEAKQRSTRRARRPGETVFEFCDTVDCPDLAGGRAVVNEWFERFPLSHKAELRRRLGSRDESDHFSALFELQLFAMLTANGLRIEPIAPQANKSTPDFMYLKDGDPSAHVEATVRLGDGDSSFHTFLQQATALVVNKQRRLRIVVSETKTTAITAGARKFAPFLLREFERCMRVVNVESLHAPKQLDEIEFRDEDSGWYVRCTLYAWHKDQAPRSTIAIALSGGPAQWSQAIPQLREEIRKKRQQHRGAELPLFVAISWHDFLHAPDEDDVHVALAGNGRDLTRLALPGVIMLPPVAVWSAQSASLELWYAEEHEGHALVKEWPFRRTAY